MNTFTVDELNMFYKYQSFSIELRGIWHMPHTALVKEMGYDETTLEGVQKLLDIIKEAGFNTIFIETTIRAHTVYPSQMATMLPELANNYYGEKYQNDYLKCFIEEAHIRNMAVHAWTSTMRAGKWEKSLEESLPKSMKEEWLARGYHDEYGLSGKYGILMWLDPSNPEVIEYLIKQYQELVRNYNLDGIEYGAIRYPVSNLINISNSEELNDFGYTEIAINDFKAKYNYNGNLKDDILTNHDLKLAWIDYRSHLISKVVEIIRNEILKIKPKMYLSAAVFHNSVNAINTVCQDWASWVKKGWLDFVSPMVYTINNQLVETSFDETEALTNNTSYNFQGIASIIEGGSYLNHLDQMLLLNQKHSLGYILFSVRQFLNDKKVYDMVKMIYNQNQAISPLSTKEEIMAFINPLLRDYQIDVNSEDEIIAKCQLIKGDNKNRDINNIIDALIKTITIKRALLK